MCCVVRCFRAWQIAPTPFTINDLIDSVNKRAACGVCLENKSFIYLAPKVNFQPVTIDEHFDPARCWNIPSFFPSHFFFQFSITTAVFVDLYRLNKNLATLFFLTKQKEYIRIFYRFSTLRWRRLLTSFLVEDKDTLRPRQNDDICICIFLNTKCCISNRIPLKLFPKSPIDNISALVQVMAWHQTGDKTSHEPIMAQFTDAYMRH